MAAVPCAHDCSQVQLQSLAVEMPQLTQMIETAYSDLGLGQAGSCPSLNYLVYWHTSSTLTAEKTCNMWASNPSNAGPFNQLGHTLHIATGII